MRPDTLTSADFGPKTEWILFEGMLRIPESATPNVRNGNLRAKIEANVPEKVNSVLFAMGDYAGGVTLSAVDGIVYHQCMILLIKRDKIKVGPLPVGNVIIAYEIRSICHSVKYL
ncbi:hypothetical protein GF377_09580 [candidate division GN15 bacterium]|nr:hypothetical protein [candidate division GN15 bacterium]